MARLTIMERERTERNMVTFFWIIAAPFVVLALSGIVNEVCNSIIGNKEVIDFWTITAPLAVMSVWAVYKLRRMPRVKKELDYTTKGGRMKKGHILLLATAVIVSGVYYYYSLGFLSVTQAIFSLFIFTFFAALLIEALSMLKKLARNRTGGKWTVGLMAIRRQKRT